MLRKPEIQASSFDKLILRLTLRQAQGEDGLRHIPGKVDLHFTALGVQRLKTIAAAVSCRLHAYLSEAVC